MALYQLRFVHPENRLQGIRRAGWGNESTTRSQDRPGAGRDPAITRRVLGRPTGTALSWGESGHGSPGAPRTTSGRRDRVQGARPGGEVVEEGVITLE